MKKQLSCVTATKPGILEGWNPDDVASFATAASVLKHTVYGDCNVFTKEEIEQFVSSAPGRIVR